ncbi:UNVERIFIED_CONTAM: hypothetical protein O8I53_08120 [Campylobacter lari]
MTYVIQYFTSINDLNTAILGSFELSINAAATILFVGYLIGLLFFAFVPYLIIYLFRLLFGEFYKVHVQRKKIREEIIAEVETNPLV